MIVLRLLSFFAQNIHLFSLNIHKYLDFSLVHRYNNIIIKHVAFLCNRKDCMAINRHEAREAVFELLFETEFRRDEDHQAIFETAVEHREIEVDSYVHDTYFGVLSHLDEIDDLINRHSNGWKTSRISRVSRSILRLCVYEMLYCRGEIPESVSLNEAIELCKRFDEEKARPFVNGVLNSIKNEIVGAENA